MTVELVSMELLSIVAVLVGGTLLVRTGGLTGWALPAFGFVAGLSLQLAVGLVQVVTPLPTTPALTLALTCGLPAAWWLLRWRRGDDVGIPAHYALLCLAAVAAAVAILRAANFVKWLTDSVQYLQDGAMLADGIYYTAVSTHHAVARQLGVPLVHSPANLADELYLRSSMPLLAVATLAILVWFYRQGVHGRVDPARVAILATLGVLVLVTNNRFVVNAFYLNGHLLAAALVLVVVGSGWLLADRAAPPDRNGQPRIPTRALMAMQVLAMPALVVTRPEGTVLAGLALLPTLLSGGGSLRHRSTALVTLGAATAAWQGFLIWLHAARETEVPASVSGGLAVGVLLAIAAVLLRWTPRLPHPTRLLWVAEAGIWLALGAFALRDPQILLDSGYATYRNTVLGAGRWGISLVVLAVLVVGAIVVARRPGLALLRFPVTTFLPVAFLLAYIRDAGAYRTGFGDSLVRMFMHLVPLAVLYVLAAYSLATASRTPARSGGDGDPTTASAGAR